MTHSLWFLFAVLLFFSIVNCSYGDSSASKISDAPRLETTVRASSCIMNTTHCHCSYAKAADGQKCLKLMDEATDRCYKNDCIGGLKCDCGAETLCIKGEVNSYAVNGDDSTDEVACVSSKISVPRSVVSRTSDVHALASQMFALIVNNDQKMQSSSGEYKVNTVELHTSDVVGLIARRMGQAQYGVKLRFTDQNGDKRVIDSTWRCSDNFWSAWLSGSFDADAHGWTAPNESTTISGDGFDKDVPWMWLGDKETMFCRLVV